MRGRGPIIFYNCMFFLNKVRDSVIKLVLLAMKLICQRPIIHKKIKEVTWMVKLDFNVSDKLVENKLAEDKKKKQENALLYVINRDPSINRTKLMKYIFFIDLYSYNKFGDTILDDLYVRLPNGPVPQYGFDLTDGATNELLTREQKEENDTFYYFIYHSKKAPDLSVFSAVERDLLRIISDWIRPQKAGDLSDKTHCYDLWKEFKNSQYIPKERFQLDSGTMEKLEKELHTKLYVDVNNRDAWWNKIRCDSNKKNPRTNEPIPMRLPELIDVETNKRIN